MNQYTTEVINAAENLILADRKYSNFTPQTFKSLTEKFKVALNNFKVASNYLYAMRETDDQSLLNQAIDIYRTRN